MLLIPGNGSQQDTVAGSLVLGPDVHRVKKSEIGWVGMLDQIPASGKEA